MAFGDNIKVVQASGRRLKIFVDYWNTVISAQSMSGFEVEIKWDELAEILVAETHSGHYGDESRGSLAGCYIFGSFSRSDAKQKRAIEKVQDDYGDRSGLFFDFKERVGKETTHKCKKCEEPIQRSSEAGVDILLAIEMIKHANMREHEYLALISSDQDFVPLLHYLKDLGQRVLHAAPGHAHREMRNVSWKQVALLNYFPRLCRISDQKTYIFYCPGTEEKLDDARKILAGNGRKFEEIDISNKNQISDRDLIFLLGNKMISLKFKEEKNKDWSFHRRRYSDNIYQFRKDLYDRKLVDGLPYIMSDGKMEAHADKQWYWMRSAEESSEIWRKSEDEDHVEE